MDSPHGHLLTNAAPGPAVDGAIPQVVPDPLLADASIPAFVLGATFLALLGTVLVSWLSLRDGTGVARPAPELDDEYHRSAFRLARACQSIAQERGAFTAGDLEEQLRDVNRQAGALHRAVRSNRPGGRGGGPGGPKGAGGGPKDDERRDRRHSR